MVVDDNRHIRMIVKTILRSLGVVNVYDVADAATGLREMRSFPVDLIICDLMMTPIDGIEFVQMVRNAQDSPDRYVPIIMLTGHTELHRVAEARDAGVHEFLAKPISADILYERVTGVIENPRPFVRSKSYFGPDRRRRDDPKYSGPERRVSNNPGFVVEDEKSDARTRIVTAIGNFLAAARSLTPRDFGGTIEQKLRLFGYLGGIIDFWSAEHLHMKVEFDFYLRKILVESEIVTAADVNMMLSSFAVVSAERGFRDAWVRGQADCAEAQRGETSYVPQGLRDADSEEDGLMLAPAGG